MVIYLTDTAIPLIDNILFHLDLIINNFEISLWQD